MSHRSFRLVHLLILVTLISQSILLPATTQAHPDNAARSYPASAASPLADLDMAAAGQGAAGSMGNLAGRPVVGGFPTLEAHAPQMDQAQTPAHAPFPQSRRRHTAGDPLSLLPGFVTQSLAGNAGNPPAPDARPSMAQAAARDDLPAPSAPVERQTPDPTATPAPHATPVPAARPRTTTDTAPAATTQLYLPLVTTGGTAAPTPAEPTGVVTLTVSPEQGGTLTSRDGRVSLDVPAGAVTRTTTIRFAPLPDQVVPGYQVVGPFFSFTARDDQGRPVTQFRRNLTMTVRYTDAPDLRETGLALHYFDEAGSAWQRIASTVETGSNQVAAQVDHFTTFTLMISRSVVGTSVPLCAGTEIWASPGDIWNNTGTPFVVPENEYHVILINPNGNSPYNHPESGIWLNSSRKAYTGASGDGTGWFNVDQADAACLANDPDSALLDFLAWLRMMRARWLEFGYAAGAAFGGDPVNMTTGNFVQQTTDIQVPGVAGFDFVLTRFYNGMDTRDGAFGTGWSSLLDTYVTVQPDDSVDVRYPDGHGAYFEPGGAGYTPGDASIKDTLEPAGAGFKLTTTDQIVYSFDAQGYLVELSERHGNSITFTRDGDGRATSITDSAGRVYTLTYEGDHVTAISDPAGRSWNYAYDGTDLISFTDANGGTWGYAYEDHRLTRLTDPLGQVFLQNSYDAEGRVTAQIDGTGGQSSFSYSDTQTIFTDNEGNQTTYTFDDRYRVTEEQDALEQTEQFTYADDDTRTAYTDKRGNTWTYSYDDQGNLLSTTDPTGVVISSSYNATNDLISITDQGGPGDSARTTSFVRNAAGDITRIERPDGTSVTATYDNRGQMRTLTDPNGGTISYAYDSTGNLDTTTDALGQVTDMDHDAVGRMTSLTDGNGHTVQMSYDGNDNITAIIDPKGQTTSFTYDGNNSLIELVDRRGGVTTYTYDANLKLLTETDPEGHTTRYRYDAMYNRVSMTDARGNVTQYRYDAIYQVTAVEDALGGITTLAYDPNGNVLTVTNALGHTTSFAYDPVNRPTTITDALAGVTTLTYDAVGRVTRTTNPRGAVTSFAYDQMDRRTTVTDALAGVWLTGYDANGNITSLTDANEHTTGMTYDAIDQRIAVTDPEGHTTQFGYDAVGNTTVITNARGFATFFTYDANDNLATMTDALAGVTTLTYDAEDTVIAGTDANGHTTQFAYDLDGMLIELTEAGGQVSTFAYDATHNLTSFTNAKGNTWTFTYDELNRRVSATDPLDHTTDFTYDAISRLTHDTDANRITTRYDYDALDRLIRVVQNDIPGVVSDHETNVTTRYSYDPVGNLVALQDANGHMTGFSYDLLDRMTQEVNPLQHTWRYAYDPVGNMTQRTDANGDTTYYSYDADDLLTRISYPDGTGVSFAYDTVHNQTVMTDTLGVTRNVYDPLDRMTSSTNHVGQSVGYEYDPVGNRTALIYPDGRTMRYSYDPTNYMVTATDPDGLVFTATRDLTHNIVRVDNPNDTFVERDIDAAERLRSVRNYTNQNPHEIISSFDYTLDPVGNRTRVESEYRWKNLPTVIDYDYTYDPLYRLIRSEDNLDHFTAYGYDAVGNRISLQTNDDPSLKREIDAETTTYSYNAANQLIESVRAVEPRGNPDRELQTAQLLRAFVHEVEAQADKHIADETAAALITQATTLFSALESNQAPDEAATAAEIAGLRAAVEQAGEAEQIDNAGIVTSLLAKLRHADDANARRGPILHVTMYDYDRNGNRIQRIAPDAGSATQKDWLRTDYAYDYENRLEHVQDFHTPGVPGHGNWLVLDETMLQFDGYGRVFRRQHDQHIGGGGDQEWVDYVYDGLDPIAEYDNPSPQYVNYYRGYGHILSFHAFKSQQSPQGTLYYLHYDGLDSVTGITKHSGQSVHNLRYHDYGTILDINGKAADASNFTDPHNHYTFTGQEWDEHTELYHFYAREYEPSTGVWLQQDPYRGELTAPKTLHRYGYVGQNPATYRDWYGYAIFAAAAVGAAIGAGLGVVTEVGGKYVGEVIQNWQDGKRDLSVLKPQSHWTEYGKDALSGAAGGAVSGGICGLTVGVGCVVGGGAAGGAANQIVKNALNDNDLMDDVGVSAALGIADRFTKVAGEFVSAQIWRKAFGGALAKPFSKAWWQGNAAPAIKKSALLKRKLLVVGRALTSMAVTNAMNLFGPSILATPVGEYNETGHLTPLHYGSGYRNFYGLEWSYPGLMPNPWNNFDTPQWELFNSPYTSGPHLRKQ